MQKDIKLLKVFTTNPAQGNPAAVVLDADDLTDQQMQQIAKHYNFSESSFIQRSTNGADFKVRFFSPNQEVSLCFHALMAAVKVKYDKFFEDEIISFVVETSKHNVKVTISPWQINQISIITVGPKLMTCKTSPKQIADILHIDKKDIQDLVIGSVGSPKLVIMVENREILFKINPDFEAIKQYCIENNINGFYVHTNDVICNRSDFHVRQFNPLSGVNEDPITGIAAPLLLHYINAETYIIEQGFILNKFGKILVRKLSNNQIEVVGSAVEFGNDKYFIED